MWRASRSGVWPPNCVTTPIGCSRSSEHLLRRQRFEVEPVGRVVVGRDRLGVAVDHHGLVAEPAERLDGVDAAVVELDALPDAVRSRAEDHDRGLVPTRPLVLLAPGRVEVVRGRVDLAAARVDAPVRGPDAARVARAAHVVAGRPQAAPIESSPHPARFARGCPDPQLALRRLELPTNHGCRPSGRSSMVAQGRRPGSSSREPNALRNASVKVRRSPSPRRRTSSASRASRPRPGTFEREARELDDDVVERRLEARRRRLR